MTVLCTWAPFDHDAPAAYWVRYERSCGHASHLVPTCLNHTTYARANPVAGRATPCPTCGAVAPVTLAAVADSAEKARAA